MEKLHKNLTLTYYSQEKNAVLGMVWQGTDLEDVILFSLENQWDIGDIYLGKVKNILPSITGAFVEISPGTQGFLNLDTHRGKEDSLKREMEIVVQIKKQAHHHKNIGLTQELSLVGDYVIVNNRVGMCRFSKKISTASKENLLEWVRHQKGVLSDIGIVFRTAAKDVEERIIEDEILRLKEKLMDIIKAASHRTCYSCLYKTPSPLYKLIDGIHQIYTNHNHLYQYLINNGLEKLSHYIDEAREIPLETIFPIQTQFKKIIEKRVWLKSGGYLVIEATEAFISIDINSGKNIQKKNKEGFFLSLNMEGCKEAFRQIRLRNLSGVIIIDLIDMKEKESQEKMLALLKELAKNDRVPIEIIDINQLQMAILTRKRIEPSLEELTRQLL